MSKIKLEVIGMSTNHPHSTSLALVLEEVGGNRRLPIMIGMAEAQAIAVEMEEVRPNRPMTHDLFTSFTQAFGIKVKEVIVSDMIEGVFFAKIVCLDAEGKEVFIDARPSDAIAISVRLDAGIYIHARLLEELGVVVADEASEEEKKAEKEQVSGAKKRKKKSIEQQSIEELKGTLERAIKYEDYEQAARLRDEIKKRN